MPNSYALNSPKSSMRLRIEPMKMQEDRNDWIQTLNGDECWQGDSDDNSEESSGNESTDNETAQA